jgi:FtsP/CotA-like multicopper oxidase with cupredoxin domain
VVIAVALASLAVAAAPPDPKRFIRVDARHRTVNVTLIAGYDGSNNGFNFDGYSRYLMWTVPRGWLVRVTCTNRGALRHSCAVVKGPSSTRPAFPGASSPKPLVGLGHGQTARFAFRATKTGVYRFACLVPGHEAARMYDVLKVVARGKPRITDLRG